MEFDRLIGLLRTELSVSTTTGFSGVEVYHLPRLDAYLKVGPVGKVSDLKREAEVLHWLDGRVGAPTVLGYGSDGEQEALMITAVSGTPASDFLSSATTAFDEIERFVYTSAVLMRQLHGLPIADCPFDMTLPVRFARCRKSIEMELLSETDEEFRAEHGGKGPWDIYNQLRDIAPGHEDLVFTHGDPCMPNIMVEGGDITGLIDLDGAGIADRYVDIAIFFRSLRRNSHVPIDPTPAFIKGYGIDLLDPDKMDFYHLIDDLF